MANKFEIELPISLQRQYSNGMKGFSCRFEGTFTILNIFESKQKLEFCENEYKILKTPKSITCYPTSFSKS